MPTGIGATKAAGAYLFKNRSIARALVYARKGSRFAARAIPGGNLATFAAVGAGMGATRGLIDNLWGQDKTSVIGGAIQGATWGAAAYGLRGMWRGGRVSRGITAGLKSRATSRGRAGFRGGIGLEGNQYTWM